MNIHRVSRKGGDSRRPLAAPGLILLALAFILMLPEWASSMPFFARQIGRSCTFCHADYPKLNETGRIFRANGYRFEDEGEWKEVDDYDVMPAAVEVEVEGKYDRTTSSGVKARSSDMVIEEAEIMAGGAFGKAGRVSALAMIAVAQTDSGTTTSYDTSVPTAFIQINDLAGRTGAGLLNVRAGQAQVALPHFGCSQRVIHNRHLAETALVVFSCEQRLVELNGSAVTPDGESWVPTHRYSAGMTREAVNDDDRMKGWYATYSLTFKEAYTFGAIYRRAVEASGTADISYNRYGASAEAKVGPFVLAAGYFKSDASGAAADMYNYILEATWHPLKRVSLGARHDFLKEEGKRGVRSQSYMARYNILDNVYTQAEVRVTADDDHVIGSSEDSFKARLFLVALF